MPDPTSTPHLNLPLPSPDASSQREDIARVATAISGLDQAIARHAAALDDAEILALALGN